MGDIVRDAGFTWGGDFSSIFDPAHVQAPGDLGSPEPVMAGQVAQQDAAPPIDSLAALFAGPEVMPPTQAQAPIPAGDVLTQMFLSAGRGFEPQPENSPDRRRQLAGLLMPSFV